MNIRMHLQAQSLSPADSNGNITAVFTPVNDGSGENAVFQAGSPTAISGSLTLVGLNAAIMATLQAGVVLDARICPAGSASVNPPVVFPPVGTPPVGTPPASGGINASNGSLSGSAASAPINGTLVAQGEAPLSFTILTQPHNGSARLTNAATGAFTYTPNQGFTGSDSFTFRVTDATGAASNTATETVSVVA